VGIVKRPSARAVPRPRIRTEAEKAELAKLDARLQDIFEGVKNLPADPPKISPTDAELEERIAALPTTILLDLFFQDEKISFGPYGRRGMMIDGKPYSQSDWGRQARAVRAEIDHRIPRRRA
jgi:hypothetical protein